MFLERTTNDQFCRRDFKALRMNGYGFALCQSRVNSNGENLKLAVCGLICTMCLGLILSIDGATPHKSVAPATLSAIRPSQSSHNQNSIRPEEVHEAEQRLSDLGYWTGPVDGELDEGSRHALIAFQKVEARKPTGRLTPEELQALRIAKRPAPLESGYSHVEVDLDRQVLFIVDSSGTVSKILPISSGTGKPFTSQGWTRRAITPLGRFTAYSKIAGWRKSPLGLLYYPVYIVGGIAIHGNPSVPVSPASHGCMRIPMYAAKQFSEMTPLGTVVIVHDGSAPKSEDDIPY